MSVRMKGLRSRKFPKKTERTKKERGKWTNKDKCKTFFDALGATLGYTSMEDWYNVTQEDIFNNGGRTLLIAYANGSPSRALQSVYPKHNWVMEKFKRKPRGFWQVQGKHKQFLDWLADQLGYKQMEDWYNVTQEDIYKNGGRTLLNSFYGGSPSRLVRSVFPEHNWEIEQFTHTPMILMNSYKDKRRLFISEQGGELETIPLRYWQSAQNRKRFFDWLGKTLGYKSMEDWYNVTQEDLYKNGGNRLLFGYYNGSPSKALQNVYPEHNWMLWRFKRISQGYWDVLTKDIKEGKRMADWLGEQFSVRSLEDWYRVSLQQIKKFVQIGSAKELASFLERSYPQHLWNKEQLFLGPIKPSQRGVMLAVQELFPNHSTKIEVEEDYKHPKLVHPSSGKYVELDLYIEDLKLALEYQGEQHYRQVYGMNEDFQTRQILDKEKREACLQNGIILVAVPYWWDKSKERLAATIHRVAPKLIPDVPGVEPIPHAAKDEQTFLLPLSRGQTWDGLQDVTGWWMSEKMDGVRGYWDGSQLLSRNGHSLNPPSWVTSRLPTHITLDGELWMGRASTFEALNMVLQTSNSDWTGVGYYVFDIPSSRGTYEQRIKEMHDIRYLLPPHVQIVTNTKCLGLGHLGEHLESILKSKGEGLMIRRPDSLYESGLTASLLKVKVRIHEVEVNMLQKFEDSEVEVVEILDNGLFCQQLVNIFNIVINFRPNGLTCIVQCFQKDLKNPPPLTSTIVVKHDGCYSSGIFRRPVFWRHQPPESINPKGKNVIPVQTSGGWLWQPMMGTS